MENIKIKLRDLKHKSGSHSPSIDTIKDEIPELKIKVDACFLSNPYATNLFMDFFNEEVVNSNKLRDLLEYYPPQNRIVAEYISKYSGVDSQNIFVSNGAIEAIQAVLHRFVHGKIAIPVPTFSSYYEFLLNKEQKCLFQLEKSNNYRLNKDEYVSFIKDNDCSSAILINPNNPNGGYVGREDLRSLLEDLKHLDVIILDESFIHFAYEDVSLNDVNSEALINEFKNLIIIKSMSKDFGIAGVRCGYAIMSNDKVSDLLDTGYLWNISGLTSYFYKLLAREDFQEKYEIVRKKYIMNTLMFMAELSALNNIKVYPTKANFVLIEHLSKNSWDCFSELLLDSGVYVRDCSDKIGLEGNFIRVASRTFEENLEIIKALKKL